MRGRPDVWLFDVTDPAFEATADTDLPTDTDRDRAAGLTNQKLARRLLARRATLRLVLTRYVDARPGELRIVTAPGGKPVLLPGPAFSVAHSGDLFAVAVANVSSLGVDVEKLRHVPRAPAIADRWFGRGEAERFASVPEDERDTAFMRLWTAKEALAKRHGAGLRLMKGQEGPPVDALDVERALSENRVEYFDAGEEYLAALASTDVIEAVNVERPGADFWTT